MMPVVSVVIPTYNRPQFVRGAVRSVLAQTFLDFELIVIDNGSVDDTSNVIRSFDDPRVRCVRIEINNGVSPARNRGIELARGEFIAFLDDDDEWLPDKLTRRSTGAPVPLSNRSSRRSEATSSTTYAPRIASAQLPRSWFAENASPKSVASTKASFSVKNTISGSAFRAIISSSA
jgi:glycosyltransferase involved in cell wall biosynthesis